MVTAAEDEAALWGSEGPRVARSYSMPLALHAWLASGQGRSASRRLEAAVRLYQRVHGDATLAASLERLLSGEEGVSSATDSPLIGEN